MGKGILGIIGGTALNEILGAKKAKRQEEAEEKRMYLGMLMSQQNAQYNQKLTKDLWDYTNYENQRKHIEAAGLNPALLYGQGGAGGATTAGAGAANTPYLEPKGEAMALQAKLVNSQVAVNVANANKINTETENVKKDTELKGSQINLNDILNAKTKEEISLVVNQAKETFANYESKVIANEISEATKETTINTAKENLNKLIAEIGKVSAEKEKIQKEIDNFEQMVNNDTVKAEALATEATVAIQNIELMARKWEKEKEWGDTKILQGWITAVGQISMELLKTIVISKKGATFAKKFIEEIAK